MERELGRRYTKGEFIYQVGQMADGLYVVQEGEVEIVIGGGDNEERLTRVGKGQLFGEVALFTADKHRFVSARALSPSRILKIDEATFLPRLHQDPSLAFRIIRHMAQRIRDLDMERIGRLQRRKKKTANLCNLPIKGGKLPNVHDFSIGCHILMVEDDPDFANLVRVWLTKASLHQEMPLLPPGFRLIQAPTLEESLTLLVNEKFDVIILDLNLPDSTGLETFTRLYERFQDMPVVVLSGMDDEHQAVAAVREGAQDYLVKNEVNADKLVHALRYAVERNRYRLATVDEGETGEDDGEDEPQGMSERLASWFRGLHLTESDGEKGSGEGKTAKRPRKK